MTPVIVALARNLKSVVVNNLNLTGRLTFIQY